MLQSKQTARQTMSMRVLTTPSKSQRIDQGTDVIFLPTTGLGHTIVWTWNIRVDSVYTGSELKQIISCFFLYICSRSSPPTKLDLGAVSVLETPRGVGIHRCAIFACCIC